MLYPTQMGLLFITCCCHEFANKESQICSMDLLSEVLSQTLLVQKYWMHLPKQCMVCKLMAPNLQ